MYLTEPKIITQDEAKKLEENNFTIIQIINLDPFEKDHYLIHAKYKRRIKHRKSKEYFLNYIYLEFITKS